MGNAKRTFSRALLLALMLVAGAWSTWAQAPAFVPAPVGTSVKITAPANNATVKSPFKVTMAVTVSKIAPAGTMDAGTGHHHLIIDGGAVPSTIVITADATHLHYGKGQTEADITLAPGKHTLTLQFADGLHRSYGGHISDQITVNVE